MKGDNEAAKNHFLSENSPSYHIEKQIKIFAKLLFLILTV
jgi:hypothetical protein